MARDTALCCAVRAITGSESLSVLLIMASTTESDGARWRLYCQAEGSNRSILILFCHLANLKGNPDYLPSALESPLFIRGYIIVGADSDLAQY